MNEIELKPCPFCGKFDTVVIGTEYPNVFYVACRGAKGGCGAHTVISEKKATAVFWWNKRAEPSNEPLTFDELKLMYKKSIYIECIDKTHYKECTYTEIDYIQKETDGLGIVWTSWVRQWSEAGLMKWDWDFEDYGITWLAYLHKKGV